MKTKIKSAFSIQRLLAAVALVVLVWLGLSHPLGAQTAFTQGYSADGAVQKGMIVRLKEGDTSKIQALKPDDIDKMHGVIVDPNDAAVTLSSDGSKVFVATAGRYEVLVCTQNGDIKEGDLITISALHGVGMKTDDKAPIIVGRALEAFDGRSDVVGATKVKDSDGKEVDVKMGRISVDITVARNPLLKSDQPNVPGFLLKAAESVAGKPVDPTRMYISLIIFGITTVLAGSLMYSGIRGALISLGRNPLSKKTIIRGMLQVVITSIIIFILGVFAVYLILKL